MPGLMIHLLVAHQVRPDGSPLFFIGNMAPDAVADWREKDETHFRNLPDRSRALADLALRTPPSDDFAEGVLLHLYVDWRWDVLARDVFIKATQGDWFAKYRAELGLAGGYAYHHSDWAKGLWQQMDRVGIEAYGQFPGTTSEGIRDFINRVGKWHDENDTTPSAAFPPAFIDHFVGQIAGEYHKLRVD